MYLPNLVNIRIKTTTNHEIFGLEFNIKLVELKLVEVVELVLVN